jgi:hypothetical protein
MNQVAAIVYVAHDAAFLRAIQATGVDVYTLTKQGSLKAIQGPEKTLVAHLDAAEVVWVGVPKKWIGKLGSLPFKSHYLQSRRWTQIASAMDAVKKIEAAKKSVAAEGIKVEQARRQEHSDRVREARRAALFVAPPIYIPQELR